MSNGTLPTRFLHAVDSFPNPRAQMFRYSAEWQATSSAEFLRRTAAPVSIRGLAATEVEVRVLGEFAIIHARSVYTTAEGKPGSRRYTDCWARRGGQWLAVSAQLTATI